MCGDEMHLKVERNEKVEIEILEGTSQFIKVPILGKVPPLKLYFEYEDSKRSDLKVCISRKS
jgi:hypothetical protein